MWRLLLLSCLTLVLGSALARADEPAAEPPPLEHFTRDDRVGTIKISPDGEFMAISTGADGRGSLTFVRLADMRGVHGVTAGERMEIRDFEWVSPQRLIYWLGRQFPGRAYASATGELFAIDRDGTDHEQIYGYTAGEMTTATHLRKREASYGYADLISRLEHDDKHILIAEYPWERTYRGARYDFDVRPQITRLNVYSGRKRKVDQAPLASARALVDRMDRVRIAFGYDEQARAAVTWKPQPEGDWQSFELPGFREDSIYPIQFSPDNRSLLFLAVREGESLNALYRLDLHSKTVERVYGHAEVEIDGFVTTHDDQSLIGLRVHTDRPQYHWLVEDDDTVRLYRMLERAYPGQAVEITSDSADGRLAIVYVYSDINPGEYYLLDRQARKSEFIEASRAWLDPQRMRPKQAIEIAARDGLPLRGYLTRPRDGAGTDPLIVAPHAGPYSVRDRWAFDWRAQLLASRGYAVLQINYRGSPGYGLDFLRASYGEWGGRMQDDLTDATRWAIEQGITDADRICILGGGYGGYAALMGAVREPALYRCAVAVGGIYDLEPLLAAAGERSDILGEQYARALGSEPERLRERSPVHQADRIEAAVMIVHGDADSYVEYEHARRMAEALEDHRKTVELLRLRGEGHGIENEDNRAEAYRRILAFLERHLPPTSVRGHRPAAENPSRATR